MYCLLCKEKIPRLRTWRTKSEFCSDEHAAQYKKQTLDRLLTEEADENSSSVPLPIDAPSFDDMDAVADIVGVEGASSDSEMDIFGDMGDLAESGPSDDLSALFGDESNDDPAFPARSDQDLGGYDGPPADQLETQSAEAALAALRAIASKGAGPSPEPEAAAEPELPAAIDASDSAGDPGSLEDFLRAREDAQQEEPAISAEELELEEAMLAPPEPTFEDEHALLGELSETVQSADEPAADLSGEAVEADILDRLVSESDWNAEIQSDLESQVDAEIEAQLGELSAADAESEADAPDAPDAPTDDDFEEAVQAAVQPPSEDAVPTDDEFVESMLAAVETVSEGAGETPADVVAFPAADDTDSASSELTREAIEESLSDSPVQVKPGGAESAEDAGAPRKLNGSRPKGRKGRGGRKAPKLKPAMVLAGIRPNAFLDAAEGDLEEWKRVVVDASPADLLTSMHAGLEGGSPLLNGSGLQPLQPQAQSAVDGPEREMFPAAVLAGSDPEQESFPATQPDVVAPTPSFTGWLPDGRLADVEHQVPTFQGRYRLQATDPDLIEAQGQDEIPSTAPGEPAEPAGLFLDVVVDERPETTTDDEGDWFADIEGFESL